MRQNQFEEFLTGINVLPFSKWEKIIVDHAQSNPNEAVLKTFSSDKNGIYAYFSSKNECLYVGKGKPIYKRICSHWREAHAKTFRSKAQDWFLFFGKKTEKLNLYILEIEDELDRQIIEKMLIRVLNPSFEKYKKQFALKKEKN